VTQAGVRSPDLSRRGRRIAAVLALASLVIAAVYVAISAIQRWDVLLVSAVSLAVTIMAGWYVVARRGTARIVASVAGLAALAVFVVVLLVSESVRVLAAGLALAAVSVSAARYALTGRRRAGPPRAAPIARHPVLLINPKSGGGKAERVGLAELCRQRGVEPIVLGPGDDLLACAEDAVARGADLLGMAGGDGSQALVASVASRHRIPFVVVPAGTRNHFALDLGLDRADAPGALDAYVDGFDLTVDLAEVNGRVFVNNASMGVYARVVSSDDYRDAKIQTAVAILPDLLGPGALSPQLRYTLPTGEEEVAGPLLLVSNNPYRLDHLRAVGTRERLDRGVLGAISLKVATAADVELLTALEIAGQLRRFAGWREWSTPELDVRSPEAVEVGVDGEALVLESPLHFVSRPGALTVRLPRASAIRSAAADPMRMTDKTTLVALWQTAFGRRGANT
jgi:diacylglycerol kinase family enzyme